MSFTTPCFIRKNTPSLREKLEEMGYDLCVCTKKAGSNCWLLTYNNGTVHVVHPLEQADYMAEVTNGISRDVDCGDDENLFISLAALRDDTDYMQWFTNRTDFIKCEREDWPDMFSVLCSGRGKDYMNELDKYHKATPTEIIAHFKHKES